MQDGKILYAMVDNTCVLKLIGAIVYSISPEFDRFLQKVITHGGIDSFVVDLTGTSYIDSTNLGLLAKLREYSSDQSEMQPTLISNKPNINEVLYNIGFASIFNIVDCIDENCSNFEELTFSDTIPDNLAPIMLKAHRELIKLNKTNKELFKDVVKYLEQDPRSNSSFSPY